MAAAVAVPADDEAGGRVVPTLDAAWLAVLAVVAFVVRLTPLLVGGGLGSFGRYDDGVYYAASDSFIHGRWPYRDFVLLHPPALMVVLTPFAWLGRMTSDATGYACGRLAFMGVGALNTVLVALIARRWGRASAIVAGSIYAVWKPAVYGEQSTLLEPLGTTATLVALLVLLGRRTPQTRRAEVIAGAVLGAAVTLKIWYVAPFAAICLWQLVAGRWRSMLRIAASGVVAIAVVVLPFAIVARGRMYDMVIRDQLLRPSLPATARSGRLDSMFGLGPLTSHGAPVSVTAATNVLLVVVALALLGCVLHRSALVLALLFAVNFGVLLASPSYFGHYAHLIAAPAALVLGVGLLQLTQRARVRLLTPLVVAVLLVAAAYSGYRVGDTPQGHPVNAARLAAAAPPGCVASDSPDLLILMDRLTSDLATGCRVAVDVSGVTYDAARRTGPTGRPLARTRNPAWQHYLLSYLLSARSYTYVRGEGQVGAQTYAVITSGRALATSDGVTLRAGSP